MLLDPCLATYVCGYRTNRVNRTTGFSKAIALDEKLKQQCGHIAIRNPEFLFRGELTRTKFTRALQMLIDNCANKSSLSLLANSNPTICQRPNPDNRERCTIQQLRQGKT